MQNNPSSLSSVWEAFAQPVTNGTFEPANDSTSIPYQKEKPSKAEREQNALDAYAEKTYFEVLKDIECLQSGTDRTKTLYAKASKLYQAQAAGQLVGFDIEREVTEAAIKSGLKPSEIKSTLTQVEKKSAIAQAIIPSGSTYTPDPIMQAEVKAKAEEKTAKQEAIDKVQREYWLAIYNKAQPITDTFKPSQYLINKGVFNDVAVSLCRQNSYTDKQGKFIEKIIRPMVDYQSGEMVGFEGIVFNDEENKWDKIKSTGCTGTTVGTIVQGDNKKAAYVVEGLADALTINQALNATVYTMSKGCIPAMIEMFSLSGQEFVLCLDNDKDVQSIIDKLPDGTKYILPTGDGIKDINDVLVKLGADAVIKQLSLPVEKSPQEQEPEQEQDEDAYKDADLISLCKDTAIAQFANELSQKAKMPRNTTFLTVLSLFSSVACRYMKVSYEDGYGSQPLGVNFCGEQPVGAAKSFILGDTQSHIVSLINTKRKGINNNIKTLVDKLEATDKSDKESKEDLTCQIAALKAEKGNLFEWITDTTPEALDATLQDSNGYFSIASAEQGAINTLMGLSYKDSKSISNRDLVLKCYNAEWHNSKRKGRETYQGYVVGNITAIAQPGMVKNLMQASDCSGVIERFIVWSESNMLGQRDHTKRYKMNEAVVNKFNMVFGGMFNNVSNDEYSELNNLSLSGRMWDAINIKRNEYEPTIADNGDNSNSILRGVIAKYDILVMKIAANLHLSVCTDNTLIHDDRVTEAMLIADAYIQHLKNLTEVSSLTALNDREKEVMDYLASGKGKNGDQIKASLYRRNCFKVNDKYNRLAVEETLIKLTKRGLLKMTALKDKAKVNHSTFTII